MTTITIDATKAFELLEAAVQEKGEDYVMHGACMYVHPTDDNMTFEPKCLVGNALRRAGVPIETLLEMDHKGDARIHVIVSDTHLLKDVTITEDAIMILRDAQSEQDSRRSWGEAVKTAKHYAALNRTA